MVNFKISKRKTALKYALLLTASFLSFNNAQAGKFKEIPFYEEEGQKYTNKVILQFDDDEGRRGYGFTIETGKIKNILQELETSIETNIKKNNKILGIDFSNSDLTEEDFKIVAGFVNDKFSNIMNNIQIENFYNLDETDINLFKEHSIIKKMNIYEEETEDSLEMKEKTPYQGFKCEVLRSVKITPSQIKSLHEDSDEDM